MLAQALHETQHHQPSVGRYGCRISLVIGDEPQLGEQHQVGRVARLSGKRWRLHVSAGRSQSSAPHARRSCPAAHQLAGVLLVHCTKLRRRPVWLLFSGRGSIMARPYRPAWRAHHPAEYRALRRWSLGRSRAVGHHRDRWRDSSKAQALFLASYCASAAHWQADRYGVSRVPDDRPAPPVVTTSAREKLVCPLLTCPQLFCQRHGSLEKRQVGIVARETHVLGRYNATIIDFGVSGAETLRWPWR